MESATVDTQNPRRKADLRAYFAGGGATAALVGAAVIVFVGVAAFVGFNGLPFGADDAPEETVAIAAGPAAAAAAATPAADAVAAAPVAPTAAALAEIAAATPPAPGTTAGPGPTAPAGSGTDLSDDGTTPPGGPPPTDEPGTLGGAVQQVDDAAAGAGLDLPLSELTGPVTGPVDDGVEGALGDAGDALGQPRLGGRVKDAVGEVAGP